MISIIIPVYNRAHELKKCLDSIIAQDYSNYEIIVVNDGSTENIDKVIKGYEEILGNKLEYVKQSNAGAPAARNAGFRRSKGEYVYFCDADVIFYPQALKKMIETLKGHEGVSYVYSSFMWGKKLFKIGAFTPEKLKSGPCINSMALIRREHFTKKGWDESIKKFQDWDLWLTMFEEGRVGYWIDEVLYFCHPTGDMSSWLPSFAYKYLPFLGRVKEYKRALEIVKRKHGLVN